MMTLPPGQTQTGQLLGCSTEGAACDGPLRRLACGLEAPKDVPISQRGTRSLEKEGLAHHGLPPAAPAPEPRLPAVEEGGAEAARLW